MRQPIFVRALTEEEHKLIEAGLRSSDAFVLRRSQILLASARRERGPWQCSALAQSHRAEVGAWKARHR